MTTIVHVPAPTGNESDDDSVFIEKGPNYAACYDTDHDFDRDSDDDDLDATECKLCGTCSQFLHNCECICTTCEIPARECSCDAFLRVCKCECGTCGAFLRNCECACDTK